ncbi:hypothetical protein K491DRAFT_761040 [Lophiostoma macrostomum CBS 122681]|uniref:Uncharacterized protein n=1 Tax=Lophiostoma macrostomum CBS 122681 TaxID=1314788 RepID=A0A6A6SV37_9PLEO|nr:hypothetical protein K491DRAFT_761040 [Lophiostoma macrostomum CBS 122681]
MTTQPWSVRHDMRQSSEIGPEVIQSHRQVVENNHQNSRVTRKDFSPDSRSHVPTLGRQPTLNSPERQRVPLQAHNIEQAKTPRAGSDALVRLQNDNEQLRQKLNEASASLAELSNTATYTLDDTHFVSEWKQLQSMIHQWASRYFTKKAPMSQYAVRVWKNANPPPQLRDLGRHWKAFAGSQYHRPLLAQAVLWRFLQVDLFAISDRGQENTSNTEFHGAYWAERYRIGVAQTDSMLRPSPESLRRLRIKEYEEDLVNYLDWRVTNVTCILKRLHRHPGVDNSHATSLIKKIETVLLPYADSEAFGGDLRRIMGKAAALDADMWKQKAYYYISRPRSNHNTLRYDSDTMDLYMTEMLSEHLSDPDVALIISPTLTKYGDSNGSGYSRSAVISKCIVSCQSIGTAPNKGILGFKNSNNRPDLGRTSSSRPRSRASVAKRELNTRSAPDLNANYVADSVAVASDPISNPNQERTASEPLLPPTSDEMDIGATLPPSAEGFVPHFATRSQLDPNRPFLKGVQDQGILETLVPVNDKPLPLLDTTSKEESNIQTGIRLPNNEFDPRVATVTHAQSMHSKKTRTT